MKIIDLIYKTKGLADFTQHFSLNCPNSPKEQVMSDIDILKANFCRYTKRTMYYAENFTNNLEKIKLDLKGRKDLENKDDILTTIPDDIFFDFDAFLFSCKSLVEGKIVERSKGFHPKVKKDFSKYAKSTFDNFIKVYLNPLRDEVVHVNNFGSAIGSTVWIKKDEISIRAFDYSNDLELQKVFNKILTEMSAIINKIATFIMYHECYLYGFPEKDITFKTGYHDYKISDYIKISRR